MGLNLDRWPWARARASLAYGRWLRWQGAPTASRQALGSAERTFRRIGARAWASQAAGEIVAAAAGNGQNGNPGVR